MKKYKIGYTTGVFDLFHIGHLNILKKAKEQCEKLIVGVTKDDLVLYKGKRSVIPEDERADIVRSIKYVDNVVFQEDMDKLKQAKEHGANVIFVGSDWKGTEKWDKIENELNENGVDVIYFDYTHNTSSTKINSILDKIQGDMNWTQKKSHKED